MRRVKLLLRPNGALADGFLCLPFKLGVGLEGDEASMQ